MKKLIHVLLALICFLSLSVIYAFDEIESSGKSSTDQPASASSVPTYKDVRIINVDDAEWCSYQKNCLYIRNVRCRTSGDNGKKYCDRKVKKQSFKVGADTFVYQSARLSIEVSDDPEYGPDYVAFGHAYSCSNKFEDIRKKFLDRTILRSHHRMQVTTIENENRCNTLSACELIRQHECSTVRDRAELRCLKKIGKYASGNKLVIKKEIYSENSGRYRVLMDAYRCDIKPIQ